MPHKQSHIFFSSFVLFSVLQNKCILCCFFIDLLKFLFHVKSQIKSHIPTCHHHLQQKAWPCIVRGTDVLLSTDGCVSGAQCDDQAQGYGLCLKSGPQSVLERQTEITMPEQRVACVCVFSVCVRLCACRTVVQLQ